MDSWGKVALGLILGFAEWGKTMSNSSGDNAGSSTNKGLSRIAIERLRQEAESKGESFGTVVVSYGQTDQQPVRVGGSLGPADHRDD